MYAPLGSVILRKLYQMFVIPTVPEHQGTTVKIVNLLQRFRHLTI